MGAAILLRDVVGEAVHRFLVGVGPLQGDVDNDVVVFARDGDDVGMQRVLQLRQVLDEAADTAFVVEIVTTAFAALIDQGNAHAGVEE
ncbi:hypothetical protein D3C81_2095190 [compost metagenome]